MNYIELINQFWQTRRIKALSSYEADLYYCLMQECNVRNWENPFECSNRSICAAIGITEKTLIEVRNRLQQKGLIEFEKGKRKEKSPVYQILYCNKVSIKESKTVSKTVSKKVHSFKTETTSYSNTPIIPKDTEFDFDIKTWRDDFDIYLAELKKAQEDMKYNEVFIAKHEKFNPGIDVLLSIEKSCTNFWETQKGWKYKKKEKTEVIDWKLTFANAISQPMNRVYKNNRPTDTGKKKMPETDEKRAKLLERAGL